MKPETILVACLCLVVMSVVIHFTPPLPPSPPCPPIALLLCTFNTPARKHMYQDVILWWLDHSPFDLFIIDCTTNPFHPRIESRCRICRFDQTSLPTYPHIRSSSTELELQGLRHAHQCFAQEWKAMAYVVKLTAKYKLPTLHASLQSVLHRNPSVDLWVQYRNKPQEHWQNSELYVVKSTLFLPLLSALNAWHEWTGPADGTDSSPPLKSLLFEHKLHLALQSLSFTHDALPLLPNTAPYPRGDGVLLTSL